VICYRTRSAIRDVARALGIGDEDIDRLTRMQMWWESPAQLHEALDRCGLRLEPARLTLLAQLVRELIGFPRHLSQHVGGFVISGEPLSTLVRSRMPPWPIAP